MKSKPRILRLQWKKCDRQREILMKDLRAKRCKKKRKEGEAKIKSILTDEQYKKYQDMRKKENVDRKKRTK